MNDKKALQSLAQMLVLHCFRNTHLENLHAGEKHGGAGGGFNDEEMKKLLIEVNDKVYTFLLLFGGHEEMSPNFIRWINFNSGSTENWDEPKLDKEWIKKI
jgi:hypothetical protein